jgi:CTP synthase (UTP-ammonia lyase)
MPVTPAKSAPEIDDHVLTSAACPEAGHRVFSRITLTCSLAGREMRLSFAPDSKVAHIYGGLGATEQYDCNFGVNPDAVPLLKRGAMRFVGSDVEGEIGS